MTAQYCYTCGHLLGVHWHVSHFDEHTGTPQKYEVYSCPARKWYHEFTGGHPMTSTEAYVYFG